MASNEAQVRTLYQNILGREADPGGLKYWTDAANKLGMGEVAKAFRVSANKELGQRGTPEATNQIYQNVLTNQANRSKSMANAYLANPDRDPTTAAAIRMHEARMAIKRGEKTPETLTRNEFPTLSTNFNPSEYFAGTKVYQDPRNQIRDQVKNWYSNEGETADAGGLKYWTDQIGKGDKTFSNVKQDFSRTLADERAKKAAAAASLAKSTAKTADSSATDTSDLNNNSAVNTTFQNVLTGLEENTAAGGGLAGALNVLQGANDDDPTVVGNTDDYFNDNYSYLTDDEKLTHSQYMNDVNNLPKVANENDPIFIKAAEELKAKYANTNMEDIAKKIITNTKSGDVQYITDGPKPGKEWEEKYGSYEDYQKNLPEAKLPTGVTIGTNTNIDTTGDTGTNTGIDTGIDTGSTVDIEKIKDTYKGAGDNKVGIGDFEAEQFNQDDVLNKVKAAGNAGASGEEIVEIIKDNPINAKGDMAFSLTEDDILPPDTTPDTDTSFDIDNTYEQDDYGSNLNSFEALLKKLEGSKKRQQRQRSVEGRRDTWAQGLASMMSNF